MTEEGVVGSKGELFPPKKIRQEIGLIPGRRIKYEVKDGLLIVKPILEILEALEEPPIATITLEEERELRKQISEEIAEQ